MLESSGSTEAAGGAELECSGCHSQGRSRAKTELGSALSQAWDSHSVLSRIQNCFPHCSKETQFCVVVSVLIHMSWCSTSPGIPKNMSWCSTSLGLPKNMSWFFTSPGIPKNMSWCFTSLGFPKNMSWCSTSPGFPKNTAFFTLLATTKRTPLDPHLPSLSSNPPEPSQDQILILSLLGKPSLFPNLPLQHGFPPKQEVWRDSLGVDSRREIRVNPVTSQLLSPVSRSQHGSVLLLSQELPRGAGVTPAVPSHPWNSITCQSHHSYTQKSVLNLLQLQQIIVRGGKEEGGFYHPKPKQMANSCVRLCGQNGEAQAHLSQAAFPAFPLRAFVSFSLLCHQEIPPGNSGIVLANNTAPSFPRT